MFSQDPLKLHIARRGGERFPTSIKTLITLEVGEGGSNWSAKRVQKGKLRERRRKRITRGEIEGPRDVGRRSIATVHAQ